ncbi:hypothetical protein [Arthrobacter sp. U41]|uniref:hypothetical protein n=1 Tax=Arthrobacter sp. U41 TaxID=1849032 RepID=UPI0008596AA2|nr:hypothetical protein [Arthrobacter sp. U41]AOT02406.1 hypothetical protein ASPU41_02600 [Arthrobacter sp. U41]
MPTVPVPSVPRTRTATATAVRLFLTLAMVMALAGCAYEYDDGFASGTASASSPAFTDAALPRDPATRRPVSGAELDAWVELVLPATESQVFHSNYGTLGSDEEREETTAKLPEGSYALTIACRSPRRVSFTISHRNTELVDLNLRCGSSRVNVVYLPAGAVLTIQVEANAGANFAYRVSRI